MYIYHSIKSQIKKYKQEIVISVISTGVGTIIGKIVDMYLLATAVDLVLLISLAIVILLQISQMLLMRRNVIFKISYLQERVDQITGQVTLGQYDERKTHFAVEKQRIVLNLIQTILPPIIEKALHETDRNKISPVALIVDSGTTLEQFFPKAKLMGFGNKLGDSELKKIQIYTNSLSGSDAFCNISAPYLNQDQLHLFGGTPIEKYRAVLGDVTLDAMKKIKNEYEENKGKIVGIITANWILVGAAYNKLIICSTEPGHLNYKKLLTEISDVLIITTPLGKLLSMDTTQELNRFLNLDENNGYDGFEIDTMEKRKRENTILLTTFRSKSKSILYSHSEKLSQAYEEGKHSVYILNKRTRPFFLDFNRSDKEQIEIEIPHLYLREHAFRVLQVPKR